MTLLVNDGKRLTEPIGVAFVEPKAKYLIYKITPARPLLKVGRVWGCSGEGLGALFSSVSLKECFKSRERASSTEKKGSREGKRKKNVRK